MLTGATPPHIFRPMPSTLAPTDFYTLYSPSECELRVWLSARGEVPKPPSAFEQLMERYGREHEARHLASLGPDVVTLQGLPRPERERRTREAVAAGARVIYQAALRAQTMLGGQAVAVIGDPDFLIASDHGYIVRDAKIARTITARDHPEILLQLELYGWLFEQMFGTPPAGLEVFAGSEEVVPLDFTGGASAVAALERIATAESATAQPYEPVGWSKCADCGFRPRCWPAAEERRDVALVKGVDQSIARSLREHGVTTYDELLERFDESALRDLPHRQKTRTKRVGSSAASILRMARALQTDREIAIAPPALPHHPNYVMFDLEGVQALLKDPEIIYLWGAQVFGEQPGAFQYAELRPGDRDDERCWRDFLALARVIRREYGDAIPWVHWARYERRHVAGYIERWGDDADGVAAWVLDHLLDALPITERAVALPLYSYSLKEIEKYLGFERSQDEFGGTWAMVSYLDAAEHPDPVMRRTIMDEIVRYNQEDLASMWKVVKWLGARAEPDANARE